MYEYMLKSLVPRVTYEDPLYVINLRVVSTIVPDAAQESRYVVRIGVEERNPCRNVLIHRLRL
jgi:hypothetical protein